MKLLKLWCGLLAAATITVGAEELPLKADNVSAKGSGKVAVRDGGIDLRIDDPRGTSGVRISPPRKSGVWDMSGYKVLAADIENLSKERPMRLVMFISNGSWPNKDFKESYVGIALNPGEKRTLRMELPHMKRFCFPKGVPSPAVIDTEKVKAVEFYMQWPFEPKKPGLVDCRISNLRLEEPGAVKAAPKPFFPFIDRYGQFVHDEWPAKIHSDADLVRNRREEEKELAASKRPAEWNRFGGWKNGPQLEATGNFRVAKYDGKWWMVDPEGRLFFSHGMDVLTTSGNAIRCAGRPEWFAFPVGNEKEIAFNRRNLQIKYGKKDYEPDFFHTVSRRLEHWGFNSIGDWGDFRLIALGETPYTMQLTDYDWKMPRVGTSNLKFYDVYDPRYVAKMRTLIPDLAEKHPEVLRSLTDPMCIGYFIDNELNFGNRKPLELIRAVLGSPEKQCIKREFIGDLKRKYHTVHKLNKAWNTSYASWSAMQRSTEVPEKQTEAYRADGKAFLEKTIDRYFAICRDSITSVAPHRLYLGCRFISTDSVIPELSAASKKYCDVLTVNIYAHSPANIGAETFPDMPVLIGEFHFGVLDRGMYSPGLCPVGVDQNDRAIAYTRFLQGALLHPQIVGAHWFQYRDQPLTGRGDGERYQIGFVDVADTPYPEICRASREVGENMYQYRLNGKPQNSMRSEAAAPEKAEKVVPAKDGTPLKR